MTKRKVYPSHSNIAFRAPQCKICDLPEPERAEIEAGVIAGRTLASLARAYSVGEDAIRGHCRRCIAPALKRAAEQQDANLAMTIEQRVDEIHEVALRILREAESAQTYGVALQAIGEARRNLDLIARLRGDLGPSSVVNIALVQHPSWRALRDKIVAALQPHPLALRDVLLALGEMDRPTPVLPDMLEGSFKEEPNV